jgi:hypothetical protein
MITPGKKQMNELIITGHPLHGFSALGEVQKNISLKFSELQKTYASSKISSSIKTPEITNSFPQGTAISGMTKLMIGASSTVAATQVVYIGHRMIPFFLGESLW